MMNKQTHPWLAAVAAATLLIGGAWAQSQGANPAYSGSNVDCPNDRVNTAGTEAAPAATTMKRSHKASSHRSAKANASAREGLTLHASFPQCAAKNERSARAECVRTAWESRHGVPGERTTVALASPRRPC